MGAVVNLDMPLVKVLAAKTATPMEKELGL
ncbi:MAG: hypothetical protein JWN00_2673, partial [Actinomycetia bacterium]|nr:hypothetical protein [Actinomycetes bacterium]